MSPLKLRVLLHYHYLRGEFPDNSPAVKEALEDFVCGGFLVLKEDKHTSTDRAGVFVKALCAVPEPTLTWSVEIPRLSVKLLQNESRS